MASYYVGDGSAGALSAGVSEHATRSGLTANAASGQKVVTVASTTGFTAGKLIFLHQTRGTGVGNYEFNRIDSVDSGTQLTLKGNLVNAYTSAATGASKAQILLVKEYSSVNLTSGTWTVPTWDGTTGGILAAVSQGAITINGGAINVDGLGYAGGGGSGGDGSGSSGEGTPDAAGTGAAPNANGNGAGGAKACTTGGGCPGVRHAGGGGGGHGAAGGGGGLNGGDGAGGNGGSAVGAANLANGNFVLGGGGAGAAVGDTSFIVKDGVKGSGSGFLVAGGNITISSGSVTARGNAGGSTGADTGGGGGGAGGAIRFVSSGTVALGTGLVIATGGAGASVGGGAGGGSGGTGRVATLSGATVTGTANPTIDTTSTDTTTTVDPWAPPSKHHFKLLVGVASFLFAIFFRFIR